MCAVPLRRGTTRGIDNNTHRHPGVTTLPTKKGHLSCDNVSKHLIGHAKRSFSHTQGTVGISVSSNYVHSLDSAHMMLTALEMEKRNLDFTAVHDSFWTHAGNIDEMNEILRDSFVDLYDGDVLEDLRESWKLRYPDIELPDLPERGDLDIKDVKDSTYFFQ
uniref:DNA-directed RNA polymerase n=1 Tax=Proboscia inermis TaxID=420281 RepID=A0A7S0CI71_9STRA|mmetsp:Transcript_49171/g.49526  ORF Transcript_49171/g.49526 Transcript_49171/m.49526 type:complete len:162 (+) Transcript_49171:548-1033(+)